jgi:hypothetical protein
MEYWKLYGQCKECASELFRVRGEHVRREHQNSLQTKRGASRFLNTLEERLCKRSIEKHNH